MNHTPALFYKTFTWNNSDVICKYLNELMIGSCDQVLTDALILRSGEIVAPEIKVYQKR